MDSVRLLPSSVVTAAHLLSDHLGAETIRMRFFSAHPELNGTELRRFTVVNYVDAWPSSRRRSSDREDWD